MIVPRYSFSLTVISDDEMIAAGGTFQSHEMTNTLETYSRERGTWELTPYNMTVPR